MRNVLFIAGFVLLSLSYTLAQNEGQCDNKGEFRKLEVIIETPTNTTNSYSLVGSQVALALNRRKDVNVYLLKLPNYDQSWPSVPSIQFFDDEDAFNLDNVIPRVDPQDEIKGKADLTIRVTIDFDEPKVPSERMAVMLTSEKGMLSNEVINGSTPISKFAENAVMIAPSTWSKMGLINSGAKEAQVKVVSHGIDVKSFKAMKGENRVKLRAKAGWASSFVFLHVSSMTSNKNVGMIVNAIIRVRETFSNVKLVLKGNDELYGSLDIVRAEIEDFDDLVENGIIEYYGEPMSNKAIAQMMQLSNCYLAPYRYEGFNLPVLEAMAVGLPVIVSKGGSTDDFVTDGVDGYLVETEIIKKEGVQLVNERLEGWKENAWEVDIGWVEEAASIELKIEENDLIKKMNKVIEEESTFERSRKSRVERINKDFNWDIIAERIVEEAIVVRGGKDLWRD